MLGSAGRGVWDLAYLPNSIKCISDLKGTYR